VEYILFYKIAGPLIFGLQKIVIKHPLDCGFLHGLYFWLKFLLYFGKLVA
jgi:hypothetical protein